MCGGLRGILVECLHGHVYFQWNIIGTWFPKLPLENFQKLRFESFQKLTLGSFSKLILEVSKSSTWKVREVPHGSFPSFLLQVFQTSSRKFLNFLLGVFQTSFCKLTRLRLRSIKKIPNFPLKSFSNISLKVSKTSFWKFSKFAFGSFPNFLLEVSQLLFCRFAFRLKISQLSFR